MILYNILIVSSINARYFLGNGFKFDTNIDKNINSIQVFFHFF